MVTLPYVVWSALYYQALYHMSMFFCKNLKTGFSGIVPGR